MEKRATAAKAASQGIHGLEEEELQRLVRALARADFAEPVSRAALVLAKFGHLEGQLDALVGHSKRAALAIITATLRERQHAREAFGHVQAAWEGPAPTGHGTRAPYEVLVELIATAERSVLFTGVDLERDARLLRSLHAAQRGRELHAVVILTHESATHAQREEHARSAFGAFKPWPQLFQPDRERVIGPLPQCLLSDGTRGVLLAGAAPEVEGQDKALSAGIVLEDPSCIAALYAQWQLLIDTGAVLPFNVADACEARE